MKIIECDIIQDLLPSYSDKISSNATNKLIEEHLQECKNCRVVLENMKKDISVKTLNHQTEQINYLKGYKRRRKILIIISIILTIIILATIFMINVFNNNILLDKPLYVDVNKFNVEYIYIKENEKRDITTGEIHKYKTLEVYMYSEKYKNMYLTGGYMYENGDTQIYYKISAKKLPKDIEFESTGLETSFIINDDIEKIYIEDTEHNVKEIWNKNMEIQSEEEWKKWYIDDYVPQEIKQLYNMSYDNIPENTSTWKHLYNKNLENSKNVKYWRIEE